MFKILYYIDYNMFSTKVSGKMPPMSTRDSTTWEFVVLSSHPPASAYWIINLDTVEPFHLVMLTEKVSGEEIQ